MRGVAMSSAVSSESLVCLNHDIEHALWHYQYCGACAQKDTTTRGLRHMPLSVFKVTSFHTFSASPLRDWVSQLCLLPQLDTLGDKPVATRSEARENPLIRQTQERELGCGASGGKTRRSLPPHEANHDRDNHDDESNSTDIIDDLICIDAQTD